MKFVLFVTLIWSILDSGWSITDEDLVRIDAGLSQIQVLTREMGEVKAENKQMKRENDKIRTENVQLRLRVARLEEACGVDNDKDAVLNTTIEERVSLLELQMTEVQDDVVNIEEDVDLINDQQVIQDQRIFSVEQDTSDLDDRIETVEETSDSHSNRITSVENQIEDLESTTSSLDDRVETLEGETSELETRLTTAETEIEGLGNVTSDIDGRVETLETRLTAAETQIEDLQMTDIELDSRISGLEEEESTIAFQAEMDVTDNDNIRFLSTMIFSDVQLNEGNGYDPATGTFTVPSGGEGYYYFATHFTVDENVYIDLRVNGVTVCTMFDNNLQVNTNSHGNRGCNAVVFLSEGDEVRNVYRFGTGFTPVYEPIFGANNGFTGFRI